MTSPTGDKADRALNLVLLIVLVVTLGTLLLGAVSLPVIIDSRGSIEAQTRSDEITACRSEYAALLTDAQNTVDAAESRRDDLVFLGLIAVAVDNEDGLVAQVRDADLVVADIADARENLDEVSRRRSEAITESRSDPEAFVERCEADFG